MKVEQSKVYNNYPTIFVHGFLGWGSEDDIDKVIHYWGATRNRDLLAHLREEGFECYNPSVGPFNGVWDRACELYARLMGGRVDYGKVHSENMAMSATAAPILAFSKIGALQETMRRSILSAIPSAVRRSACLQSSLQMAVRRRGTELRKRSSPACSRAAMLI